ncbi:MAG: nitroreductase family deazaflavin-dependent oxidoreductase [Acidobacteria bacterium]|nr:nitroreductase family deazaflavin-dependent oxidoreductase [Acidobacteriota bacterium]
MPLPRGLARFNRSVTNRITKPAAARLGGFGVLHHHGRRSGNEYETPLNAWRQGSEVIVALTYGLDVDWLKNVREAESSIIVMGGKEVRVGRPEIIPEDEGLARVPKTVGRILGILDVNGFVVFPVL